MIFSRTASSMAPNRLWGRKDEGAFHNARPALFIQTGNQRFPGRKPGDDRRRVKGRIWPEGFRRRIDVFYFRRGVCAQGVLNAVSKLVQNIFEADPWDSA